MHKLSLFGTVCSAWIWLEVEFPKALGGKKMRLFPGVASKYLWTTPRMSHFWNRKVEVAAVGALY